MKISCSTTGVLEGPLSQSLPLIRQAGGEAVELSLAQVQAEFPDVHDRVSQVQRLLQENNLALSGLLVPDLAVEDGQDWEPMVVLIREEMAFARSLNVASVNVHAGVRGNQSVETLANGLSRVLPEASALGLTINLANHLGTRIEQIEDVRSVLTTSAHPALRVLNDVGHFLAAAVNPRDVLAEFQHHTDCVHLSDRIGKRPVPIGKGKANLSGIVADLKRMNYSGWLVMDLETGVEPDVKQGIVDAIAYVRQLLETDDVDQ